MPSSTSQSSFSTRSFPRARSACASMSSTATTSITVRTGSWGGAYFGQVQTSGRPIQNTLVPPGTPSWGAKWKEGVRDSYLSTLNPGTGVHGSMYSYRDVYTDLDPIYRDRLGRPL